MSYPLPPGITAPSPSLPNRPPASGNVASASASAFGPPPGFVNPFARAVTAVGSGYGAPSAMPAAVAATANYSAVPTWRGNDPYHYQQQQACAAYASSQLNASLYGRGAGAATAAVPQISNPFPAPKAATAEYDPEMAAAIAQWQMAYVPRDPTASGTAATDKAGDDPADGSGAATAAAEEDTIVSWKGAATAAAVTGGSDASERKKTVVREGGGKKWTDDSLLEWDPSHLRLFVGNLGGETTDNSLLSAFARWGSVQKARVIRDKRTNKSKGYGFVSFSDADDFFSAAKEMTGKYIGSHPVVIRKATTEIKVSTVSNGGGSAHGRNRKRRDGTQQPVAPVAVPGSGSGADGRRLHDSSRNDPRLGVLGNEHRVTKPGQKTKNGLRLLG